jgi:hypothetical protein
MGNRKICYKKKSTRSIMKRIRLTNLKSKKCYILSPNTSNGSMMSVQNQSTSIIHNVESKLNFYSIIHMNSLISLLKQVLCSNCSRFRDGSVTIKERNGLCV